jgi:hypothetical protein
VGRIIKLNDDYCIRRRRLTYLFLLGGEEIHAGMASDLANEPFLGYLSVSCMHLGSGRARLLVVVDSVRVSREPRMSRIQNLPSQIVAIVREDLFRSFNDPYLLKSKRRFFTVRRGKIPLGRLR